MDLGLQGKAAVVVGGSRGIGKVIATQLAGEGADVALVARTKAQLEATAEEIKSATKRRVVCVAADVTDRDQVHHAISKAAEELNGFDILINSGSSPGGKATGPIDTIDDNEFLSDFNIKYMGALRCARAAIPHLIKRGWGRIINISGLNARIPGNLSAGARNASLAHLTKTLANQLGRHGITVNCIYPSIIRTERTPALLAARAAKLGISAQQLEEREYAPDSPNGNAICRMVDAADVAHLAVFVASQKASAITGEVLVVSGGAGQSVYY